MIEHDGTTQVDVTPNSNDDVANQSGHPTSRNGNGRPLGYPVDSQVVADPSGTRVLFEGHPAFPGPQRPRRHWLRWIVLGGIVAAILGTGVSFGVPYMREALETVSTDDAFVAGHITNVSPRIEGVVTAVWVEQDDRVAAGQMLVQLDREPYQLAVDQAAAALQEAEANLVQAHAQVRAQIAQARGAYYRKKNAQETVRQQVATLRAQFATFKSRQASLELARNNRRRGEELLPSGGISKEELDQRNNTLKVALEQEKEAWAAIQRTRAALGLAADVPDPLAIPKDLEVQQSTVQTAVSDVAAALAQVGIPINPKDAAQAQAFEDFLRPTGSRSAGEGLEAAVEQAPAVQVARAAVARTRRQLEDARLRLSYTEIRSEVAGTIQDRSVHPGTRVEPGQTLLSIRPDEVWVEANYKETQLRFIRIGHPVDLYVDAYPGRVFRGRVAGFSPGTGLSEALLPPQNATGNYVKVTQRLPVRIELVEPNPADTPLFVGLSVVPEVRYREPPTGPEAGRRLPSVTSPRPPETAAGPAGHWPGNRGD
jgi:membrane fusion protein (multidrug efflux system)